MRGLHSIKNKTNTTTPKKEKQTERIYSQKDLILALQILLHLIGTFFSLIWKKANKNRPEWASKMFGSLVSC